MKFNRLFPALLAIGALAAGAGLGAQTPQLSMPGFPAPGSPPIVTLVSAGAAPRKAIRYTVAATHKATMDITTTVSMAMNLGGMAMPMDMPPMKMTADLAVTGVAPNGDITYNMAFTGLSVENTPGTNPAIAAALQNAAAGITSMKVTSTISSRGLTRATKLDAGDPTMQQLLGQMTSQIENLSNPFPEEAVGTGARWEVRQAITSGGQTSFLKTEYEVVSIDGNTVSLKTKTEQTAPRQTVANPMLPAGAEMTLESLTGSGTGTGVIRLDSLVPTVEANSTVSMAMAMTMGGASQPVSSDMKMKMTVAPAKNK